MGTVLDSAAVSSSCSPEISSSEWPLGSGTKKMKTIPKKLVTPSVIKVFLTLILSTACTKRNASTKDPALSAAAYMPRHVDLSYICEEGGE
ncbi:hypothetical protein EUGRSUZ_B02418 [Eucalyptus grandis]|uniref:Uncharacterized protein n=2 Tax=Eucalyptus grandis TaxID=71139 RepID=A0ACC3LTQ5_EUCGR|nr:hypothetical protein EUGRSUZ_B02418 [Eucalyptus grandis]